MLKDVVFHGKITIRKEIFETLQKYSLFVMTSNTEGLPYTIIESLSMGIPVIIRNTFPAASSLVINNYNGLIFDKNVSPEEIAYEIKKLLKNKNKLIEMSKNSIEHFNKNFTIEKFNENWKKIIDSK